MKVLTIGSFSVPHIGHAAYLRACERFGTVTVGVNSDAFIESYRGKPAPFTQNERMELIRSLGYRVVLNDGPGRELIYEEHPDLIVVGTDWARRDYLKQIDMTQDELDEWVIGVAYIPMRPAGISATEVMRRCQ